jgi:hypothetical protein
MMEWSDEALVAVLEEMGRIEDAPLIKHKESALRIMSVLAPYALRLVHEREADATTAGRISGLNRALLSVQCHPTNTEAETEIRLIIAEQMAKKQNDGR